jgi:hypothetical protein
MNSKFSKFIRSEWVLGILVALLSVLIAAAAYQSSLFDSKESDLNVEGQKQLTESNSLYLEANQFVIYDYQMYDGWYINDGTNDELAQYYMGSFSEELTASMDREDGLFDDQYYTEMYAEAEATYDGSTAACGADLRSRPGTRSLWIHVGRGSQITLLLWLAVDRFSCLRRCSLYCHTGRITLNIQCK